MNELIDYARPLMLAERALKTAHDFLLAKNHTLAVEELYKALVEVRIAIHSVNHVKEQEDAVRKQTTPVQTRVRDVRRDARSKKEAGS